MDLVLSRCSRVSAVTHLTRSTEIQKDLPTSTPAAQETSIRFEIVGEIRQTAVMLTGRLGRFGSTPGRFDGMRLGSGAGFPLTLTLIDAGKLSG